MNIDPQVLEDAIKRHKATVTLHEAFVRLQSTRDYKAVIADGYFKDEAVRLVHLRVDPSMQNEDSQSLIMKQIDGIGSLVSFLHTLEAQAEQALKAINGLEADLEEIRGGGNDD